MEKDLLYLVDAAGKIQAVQLSVALWQKVEKIVLSKIQNKEECIQKQGPLNDFKLLMQYWDFSYPYSPEVECPHCKAKTEDWRLDKDHTFVLTNANLGGLIVFHCTKCNTTIRYKHFKDHVSIEHTTPKQSV